MASNSLKELFEMCGWIGPIHPLSLSLTLFVCLSLSACVCCVSVLCFLNNCIWF